MRIFMERCRTASFGRFVQRQVSEVLYVPDDGVVIDMFGYNEPVSSTVTNVSRNATYVRLPGHSSIEDADVLVLYGGAGGEVDGDAPLGVVGRGEQERARSAPVRQLAHGASKVDVL